MRPIELAVAGLNSFREKQVIPFETLQESGVFGIFGPTGSGKSTILDAMTLALYGKVERAANNTQGIMNHAEHTLSVSFTFELGKGSETKRFKVERAYKRNGDLSVRSSHCRFVEIGDEEVVLADKERDVTAMIQHLLGLTIDDFTRAVVLPQGKFAEFLSLKGAERRKMLERLFHLEQYGDKLNKRLKTRLDETKAALQNIEASQHELGQASKSDVEQAEEKKNQALLTLEVKRNELENTERDFQEWKQVWQWQQEKTSLETKKASLDKKKAEIDTLNEKFKKALEADRLMPYFDDWKTAENEANDSRKQLLLIQDHLEKAIGEFEQTKRDYEKKKQEKETNAPKLIQQIEQYKYAQKLEQQWTEAKTTLEKKTEKQKAIGKKVHQVKGDIDELQQLVQRAEEKQEALKVQLESCAVDVRERERVQQAVSDKRKIESIAETKQEIERESADIQKEETAKRTEYDQILENVNRIHQRGRQLCANIEKKYNQILDLKIIAEKQEKKLLDEKQKAEAELERLKQQALALLLAEKLNDGAPCPVCGSTHHPSPAKHDGTIDRVRRNRIENQIETFQYESEELKAIVMELNHHRSRMEYLFQSLIEKLPEESDHSGGFTRSRNEKLHSGGTHGIFVEAKSLTQDVVEIEEQTNQFFKQLEQLERKRFEAESQAKNYEEKASRLTERLEEISKQYQQAIAKWKKTYEDKSLDTIESEQKAIIEKDRIASEINARIKKSIPFLEEKKQLLERLKETYNNLRIEKEKTETEIKLATLESEQLKAQLETIVGSDSPFSRLKEAEEKLQELNGQEGEAYQHYNRCAETKQSLEKQASKAEETFRQLNKRKEEAAVRWRQMLADSLFETNEELKDAYADYDQKTEWESHIRQFHEAQTALEHDLKRLQNHLKDRHLTEREWTEWQERYETCKREHDAAKEELLKAEYDLQDVKKRHERFMALEHERKKVQRLVDQLSLLEKIFRGNAFVEFLAEEQLIHVTKDASVRLGKLTRQRYAIEVNSEGGFVIRDDANGGIRRPVTTLSGGETFLTSLALALSLSSQIQLRGKYPLEFFFLDEGFGTLDQELLDTVITSLEKLHMERLSVGIISHVLELQERLSRKLIVHPAEPSGRGSRVTLVR